MELLNQWALPILLIWPVISTALVILTPGENTRLIKQGSIAASLLPLGLSIYMLVAYDYAAANMAFEVQVPWIESLNASFHVGVDGLSLPLVFLTTLLSTLSIYYSAKRHQHARQRVLRHVPSARTEHDRRVHGAGLCANVLRVLGNQPGADVHADRHLGRR